MASRPHSVEFASGPNWEPRVINGSGGAGSRYTHVGDTNGGGGSGGDPMIDIAEIKQSLSLLWKISLGAITAGIFGFVGLFFILDDRLQGRFDIADERLQEIREKVAGQSATLEAISKNIERLSETKGQRNADQPQGSGATKPT